MILKTNLTNNFFYLIFSIFAFFFILNYENYIGNKTIFFLFNLSSFAFFLFISKSKLSSFEFFFYIFLLLSFWFKFSCILFFDIITVTEGDFNLSNKNYDEASIVIIFTFFTCIFTSFIKNYFFRKFLSENILKPKKSFINFYKNWRLIILITFISFLLLIWKINLENKIYLRGLINQDISFYIYIFFSWSFTYGLSVITSLLIYIDFIIFKNKKYFILGIFETIFSHMTIYSRAFFLSIFAYLRGYYYLVDLPSIKVSKSLFMKLLIFILIFTSISFFIVNNLRNVDFNNDKNIRSLKIKDTVFEFIHLSVNRWIGIDGLLSVSQSDDLGYGLLISSLYEEKKIRKKSFYINNFFKKFEYSDKEVKNLNIVITPGLIAFLYYTGSVFFVCIALSIVILFCSFLEKLFSYASGKNTILTNIIGYALAVRFIHFGYVPYNTINYLFSLIVTLLIIYLLNKLIKR
jgi:hypothetical protein